MLDDEAFGLSCGSQVHASRHVPQGRTGEGVTDQDPALAFACADMHVGRQVLIPHVDQDREARLPDDDWHTASINPAGGFFKVALTALKDKRRSPGWRHAEVCHGPVGVR
jgi:hypothetical protein